MKSGKSNLALILILLILGMAAVSTYYLYKTTQQFKLLPFLAEEIGPYPVLTKATIGELKPGMVYLCAGDKSGWQIKEKDTALYEKLTLSSVDLGPNDVIAPHLWDWWLDGQDDYVDFGTDSSLKPSIGYVESMFKPADKNAGTSNVFRAGQNGYVIYINNNYDTLELYMTYVNSSDTNDIRLIMVYSQQVTYDKYVVAGLYF